MGKSSNPVETLGRRFRCLTFVLILITPFAFGYAVWRFGPMVLLRPAQGIQVDAVALKSLTTLGSLTLLGIGSIIPVLWLAVLGLLHRLFGLYARGEVFGRDNIHLIRRCGIVLVLIDVARIAQSMLLGPVLGALGVAPSYFVIELQASISIVGLFIVLIGQVMAMARELEASDRLTI
jgi:hypothetical protein